MSIKLAMQQPLVAACIRPAAGQSYALMIPSAARNAIFRFSGCSEETPVKCIRANTYRRIPVIRTVLLASAVTFLSACADAPTTTSNPPAATATTSAASEGKIVTYKGITYSFERIAEKPIAYVQASTNSSKYTVADVEALTRQQTGCRAKLDAGVLGALSGFGPDADLSIVNYRGKPFRWSLALSC